MRVINPWNLLVDNTCFSTAWNDGRCCRREVKDTRMLSYLTFKLGDYFLLYMLPDEPILNVRKDRGMDISSSNQHTYFFLLFDRSWFEGEMVHLSYAWQQ